MNSSSDRKSETPDTINPYEVTALTEALPPESAIASRCYAIHLDWADRRRFLKAVGPLRIAAILGAVNLVGSMVFVLSLHRAYELEIRPATLLSLLQPVLQTLVAAYSWWLHWRLADAIASVAGGTSSDMYGWSKLQLKLAYAMLIVIGLAVLFLVGGSLVIHAFPRR